MANDSDDEYNSNDEEKTLSQSQSQKVYHYAGLDNIKLFEI